LDADSGIAQVVLAGGRIENCDLDDWRSSRPLKALRVACRLLDFLKDRDHPHILAKEIFLVQLARIKG
jgi:hypothetical protein